MIAVDPDPETRSRIRTALAHTSVELEVFSDPATGLAAVFRAVDRCDLLICDLVMPGYDMVEVVTQLRKRGGVKRLPILFLSHSFYAPSFDTKPSSGVKRWDEALTRTPGVTLLPKPVTANQLYEQVRGILGGTPVTLHPAKERLLIVEDDPDNVEILQLRLGERYDLAVARNGREGIDALEREDFLVVLTDIQMPEVSGLELLDYIRKHKPSLGVVVMTAYGSEHIAAETVRKGADDYIIKPIDKGRLYRALEDTFERARLRRLNVTLIEKLSHTNRQLMTHTTAVEALIQQRTEELETKTTLLIQAEKLAALGQIITGVAHEINTPLTNIKMYTQLLEKKVARDPAAARFVDVIIKNTDAAATIITNLLSFSRKRALTHQSVDVNAVVRQTVGMLARQLELKHIRVESDLDLQRPMITADPLRLQQVLLNLLINAKQAMAPSNGTVTAAAPGGDDGEWSGAVTIRTGEADGTVTITVADTGPGVAPEHIPHLFDPFFSTKGSDDGVNTGLGLSICREIVDAFGGTIDYVDRDDMGAVFELTFDAAAVVAAPSDSAPSPQTRSD